MRSRLVLAVAAAGAVALATQPGGAAAPKRLSWDAPVLVSDGRAAREMSLVLDPTDERRMVACAPSGVINRQNEQSHFYRTTDAGRTWSYLDVEPEGDTREHAYEGGDCDVAYDAAGTMYVADTWVGNLSVGASRDGGRTWTGTPLAGTVPIVDRPWIVGGAPGTVYVTYQALQGQMPTAMWFTMSTDYGRTFSPAVPITTANADGTYTWEGNVVASPDGRSLYLVHTRRLTPADPIGPGTEDRVQLAYSHDGGLTWATRTVAVLPERPTPATLYPIVAMDGGGHLHVTWSAPRTANGDTPVYYTTSADKGATWSTPLPIGAGRDGWAPWVAGGHNAGEAALAWLDSPDANATQPGWYFGYATVAAGRVTATGTTTTTPMWTGPQVNPEFETVRIGRDGRLHLGMAVYREGAWALYYQRQR